MPWDCKSCNAQVNTDDAQCPTCGVQKDSWTIVADRTRTFAVTTGRAKEKYFRGTSQEALEKGQDYAAAELEEVEEAVSVEKEALRQLLGADKQPAPDQLLVVRIWPKGAAKLSVTLTPETEMRAVEEHPFPVERGEEAGETVDARFLLVHGKGEVAAELPGVALLDVSDDTSSGHAPRLGARALTKKNKVLPIRCGLRALVWSH